MVIVSEAKGDYVKYHETRCRLGDIGQRTYAHGTKSALSKIEIGTIDASIDGQGKCLCKCASVCHAPSARITNLSALPP